MAKLLDYRLNLKGKEFTPLVTGGMGVDISTSELACAIARLGGIGHISDAMAPCISDRKFGTNLQESKKKAILASGIPPEKGGLRWDAERTYQGTFNHVRSTMEQKTGPGEIWINVMEKLLMGEPQETMRARLWAALDGGIDGITLSAGLHTGTLKLIEEHPRFNDARIGIIVSSSRALRIFLRGASRTGRLPDYVVVEGPLAGGHLGFPIECIEQVTLDQIVDEVLAFLKAEDIKIPVIAAGGIFTGSDAVRMLERGASALQVATRFTISKECGFPHQAKQDYLRATEEDVVVNMTSPTGYPMRMLRYSPSLGPNPKPQCEALGYIIDKEGNCEYRKAYFEALKTSNGTRPVVSDKMCICHQFMNYRCYTCGHYVYRLRETTVQLPNGQWYLPPAEHIFRDYCLSENNEIALPAVEETAPPAQDQPGAPGL